MAKRLWEDFIPKELSGPKIERRTSMKLMGAAGLSALAGCMGGDDGDGGDGTTPPEDEMGGSLVAGWNVGAFSNLDPPYATDTKLLRFINNIHWTPLQVNDDFTFSGDLAEDLEVSKESRNTNAWCCGNFDDPNLFQAV